MLNKFLYNCELFPKQTNESNFFSCISAERKDSILLLKNPQLVYFRDEIDINSSQSSVVLDTNLIDIDLKTQDVSVNFVNKFDKKNKNNLRLDDGSDSKKNKIKQKKKTRSKISLINDDIFIEDSNIVANNHSDTLNLSLIRPIKSSKQKKKQKVRKGFKDTEISVNLIEHEKRLENNGVIIDNNKHLLNKNKEVILDSPLTIQQLADKLQISEAAIITWLFLKGISVTINQVVDISLATEVAKHYDFTILDPTTLKVINSSKNIARDLNFEQSVKRAPIITIFGHVDHGKTTLLDCIRKTNLVCSEAGGITQSIAGYEVEWPYMSLSKKLVFLDTPGHEAFTGMRLRGAEVTDLAILVVAADDGLKPQSIEAINHIISRKIPHIVAINKIDKENINIQKIKEQLANHGIMNEDWGGQTPIIEVSALTGKNIDVLLSSLCALAESQDLRADPSCSAEGTIIEAHLDRKTGPIATLVIKNGTLKVGDIIVSGNIYGRIKLIMNSSGIKINQAIPSAIVKIWGFSSVPRAGMKFYITYDEKEAKQLINNTVKANSVSNISTLLNTRVTLDTYNNKSNLKQVNIILKTDMQGSIEAIIQSFSQIPQEKVQINVLSYSSGSISDRDIDLAITSHSIILGFNINVSADIRYTADKYNVTVSNFNVIYDLLDYIKQYMLDLVDPEYDKVSIGKATVQTIFNINKGTVAGCIVSSGKLKKNSYINIYRNDNLVYDGILNSLKRVKDDIDEVIAGNECGVMCIEYNLWNKFDVIEAYELIEKEKIL